MLRELYVIYIVHILVSVYKWTVAEWLVQKHIPRGCFCKLLSLAPDVLTLSTALRKLLMQCRGL